MNEITESGPDYDGGLSISHDYDDYKNYDDYKYRSNPKKRLNAMIGCGIFVLPGDVWRLTKSPGVALIFWIIGGVISFLGIMIYRELDIMLPRGAIIADVYAASLYFVYAIRGEDEENRPSEYLNPGGYFSKDFLRLAAGINLTISTVKVLAFYCMIIAGMVQLRETHFKNHWTSIFNNTISDQRTYSEQIGSYGNAMLE
ncbi:817_t:CDS:2, partial [Racocetra persica]